MLKNRPNDALGTLVKLVRCCKILQNCPNSTKLWKFWNSEILNFDFRLLCFCYPPNIYKCIIIYNFVKTQNFQIKLFPFPFMRASYQIHNQPNLSNISQGQRNLTKAQVELSMSFCHVLQCKLYFCKGKISFDKLIWKMWVLSFLWNDLVPKTK